MINSLGYEIGRQTVSALSGGPDQTLELLGREWFQDGDVFGGQENMAAAATFTEWLPLESAGDVLELGCGVGVTAVMAALAGARVLATDVNPAAVRNVLVNAEKHGVADRVEALVSDVFDAIPDDRTFDTIYWNGPFIQSPPDEELDGFTAMSVFDRGYEAHKRFIAELHGRLNPGGQAFLGFSAATGDLGLISREASAAGLDCEIFRQQVFEVPPEALGTAPVFAEHAGPGGLLTMDFSLLRIAPAEVLA